MNLLKIPISYRYDPDSARGFGGGISGIPGRSGDRQRGTHRAGCARRILAATGRPMRLPFLMTLTLKDRNGHINPNQIKIDLEDKN